MATQTEIPSQFGKMAVATGATGGLGYETALALAKAGAEVILTGRDDRKGQSAIEKISREVIGAKISCEHLDLASLASIADFARRMGVRQSLDLLINNAGVMALLRRQTTADGFEMQFGTNHLGHFALTARLMLRRVECPAPAPFTAPGSFHVSSPQAVCNHSDLRGLLAHHVRQSAREPG